MKSEESDLARQCADGYVRIVHPWQDRSRLLYVMSRLSVNLRWLGVDPIHLLAWQYRINSWCPMIQV